MIEIIDIFKDGKPSEEELINKINEIIRNLNRHIDGF